MSHPSIVPITRVARYARGTMMGGAKHGTRKIVQARMFTSVMSGHLRDRHVEELTHVVATSIDNPFSAMMTIARRSRE